MMPGRQEIPSTLRRSSAKAQRTWVKAHDSAAETYGEGERAHRVAFSALKHSFEKVGDRWRAKERPGPSEQQARGGAGRKQRPTAAGVDARATKRHLLDIAKELDIPGRWSMTKSELVRAIGKANASATRRSAARR